MFSINEVMSITKQRSLLSRHLTYAAHHIRLDQVTVLKNLHPLNLKPKLLVVWKHRIQMNFTLTIIKNMNIWSLLNLETCNTLDKTFIIVQRSNHMLKKITYLNVMANLMYGGILSRIFVFSCRILFSILIKSLSNVDIFMRK